MTLVGDKEQRITRIVSGGQTGADRGGLDAAIALGIAHGGWCPQGRLAEDGIIPACYLVREIAEGSYAARTRMNVEDSDGTLLFTDGPAQGGSRLTLEVAAQIGKPLLHIDFTDDASPVVATTLHHWVVAHRIATLNVAGSRESEAPGIQQRVRAWIETAITHAFPLGVS
jgi:hypothetical protein